MLNLNVPLLQCDESKINATTTIGFHVTNILQFERFPPEGLQFSQGDPKKRDYLGSSTTSIYNNKRKAVDAEQHIFTKYCGAAATTTTAATPLFAHL